MGGGDEQRFPAESDQLATTATDPKYSVGSRQSKNSPDQITDYEGDQDAFAGRTQ